MSESVPHMSGGYLATAITMFVTYASGWLLDLSGWVGQAWANVTPGQAALVVGLLTFFTHNAPKLFRARAGLRPKSGREGKGEG